MKVDELIRNLTLGKNSSDWGINTFYHITAKQILCNILQVNMRQDSVSPSCPKLIQSCVEAVSKVSQNFLYVVHVVPQWCQVVCIEVAMLTLDVLQWLDQSCFNVVIEDWWGLKSGWISEVCSIVVWWWCYGPLSIKKRSMCDPCDVCGHYVVTEWSRGTMWSQIPPKV